jgi:hypothetical protein
MTTTRGRRARLAAATALTGAVALAASGCVVITSDAPVQRDVVGDVRVTVDLCASGGSCPLGNAGRGASEGTTAQLLMAYRVPAEVVAPPALTAIGAPGVTFRPSAGYASELERLLPAGQGRRWVGYITDPLPGPPPGTSREVVADFTLPRGTDGGPYAGPFRYRVVAGSRLVEEGLPAGRPVVCDAEDPAAPADGGICLDSPPPAALAGVSELATRDLGVLGGTTGTAAAGASARMTFRLRYAGGSTADANFSLSATTGVPGASVAVTPPTLIPPADSTTDVVATVGVPPGTAPGDYDVTLRAALANGQVRSGTGQLRVTAAPAQANPSATPPVAAPPAPVLRVTGTTARRVRLGRARQAGIRVRVVPTAGTGRVVLRLHRGRGRAALASRAVVLRGRPAVVTLRSRRLAAGPFRVTITTPRGAVTTLRGTLLR